MVSKNFASAPPMGGDVNTINLVPAIADWCLALDGRASFNVGLKSIANAFGATAATLAKVSVEDGQRSLSVDLFKGPKSDGHIERSYSDIVIGAYADSAKVGSLWFSGMAPDAEEAGLETLYRERGHSEIIIVVLGREGKWTYLIELHFQHRQSQASVAMITSVADTLSRTWVSRTPGLFSEALLDRRPLRRNISNGHAITSYDNPAGLSRAEFRVCMLFSNGLNKDAVRSELGIKRSTMRSHLRHIFAKTECGGLNELCHRLLMETRRPSRTGSERHIGFADVG